MNNTDEMVRVFIGYDSRLPVLYNVAQHSIIRHATTPVSITPINAAHLKKIFNRERVAVQSTEFSFSRFLTPYLCDFKGWAIFIDNDVIARADIAELWALRDDTKGSRH